jgi:hypothetical protein
MKIQAVTELNVQNGDRRDVMPPPINFYVYGAAGPIIGTAVCR